MSPAPSPKRMPPSRAALHIARWVSIAPFGAPVVPDVKTICATSSGSGGGSARSSAAPSATKSVQSANAMTSRNSGSVGCTAAMMPARSLPRCSSTNTTPAVRDRRRRYSTSFSRSAGLTGTSASCAMAAAKETTSDSGMLGASTASRSPGANRAAKARATASASVASSAYVRRLRSAGSAVPATSATQSGARAAASRTMPAMVEWRIGSLVSAGQCDSLSTSRLGVEVGVEGDVVVPDAALLVAPDRDVRLHRRVQPALYATERGAVLVQDAAEVAELGNVGPRLVLAEVAGRHGRGAGPVGGDGVEEHHLHHTGIGIVAVGPEAVHERGREAGPRHEVGEQEVLDAVERLGVGDVREVASGAFL